MRASTNEKLDAVHVSVERLPHEVVRLFDQGAVAAQSREAHSFELSYLVVRL